MWVETLPLCRYIVVGSSKYLLDHAAARAGFVLLFWGPDFHTASIKIEALALYEMTNLVTGKYVDLNFCAQASVPEKRFPRSFGHMDLCPGIFMYGVQVYPEDLCPAVKFVKPFRPKFNDIM
jgi:hypothetical protein